MNKIINLNDPNVYTMSFLCNDSGLGLIVVEEDSEITEINFSTTDQVELWMEYLHRMLIHYKKNHVELEQE